MRGVPIYSPRKGVFDPLKPIDGLELIAAVQKILGERRRLAIGSSAGREFGPRAVHFANFAAKVAEPGRPPTISAGELSAELPRP